MPLEKSASYWADLVHADHPHKPLPANTGQQKGTLTKRQRGSRLDAKNTPQGVIIASEFTVMHRVREDDSFIVEHPVHQSVVFLDEGRLLRWIQLARDRFGL